MVAMLPEYEDCSISNGSVGFVKFSSAPAAADAHSRLQGFVMDEEGDPARQLSIEYAKRELEYRPPRNPPPRPQQMYAQPAMMDTRTMQLMQPMHQMPMHPRMVAYDGRGGGCEPSSYAAQAQAPALKRPRFDAEPGGSKDTLCLRRIPPGTTQESVQKVVENLHGFSGINFANTAGGSVAFVQFASVEQAEEANRILQGAEIHDSMGAAHSLLVEFARRSSRPASEMQR